MRCSILALSLLLSCAQTAPERRDPAPTQGGLRPAPVQLPLPGATLPEVRQALGDGVRERRLSATESVLEGLYGEPCRDDLQGGPLNLSRPPCGAARLLTIRLSGGKVVSVEWGDPPP